MPRTLMQKVDFPGSSYETATAIAELTPSADVGRHTHPGPETGYVLDSEGTLWVDGNPPQALKPGRFLGDRNGRRAGSTHAQVPANRRMSGELTRRRAPPRVRLSLLLGTAACL